MDCFLFFKQKTAYEMRISDWSSDVGSSDLTARHVHRLDLLRGRGADRLVIAVADREIIADRALETAERDDVRFEMAAILAIDAEREAPLLDREREPIDRKSTRLNSRH